MKKTKIFKLHSVPRLVLLLYVHVKSSPLLPTYFLFYANFHVNSITNFASISISCPLCKISFFNVLRIFCINNNRCGFCIFLNKFPDYMGCVCKQMIFLFFNCQYINRIFYGILMLFWFSLYTSIYTDIYIHKQSNQ